MRILEVCMSEYLGGLELYYLRCCSRLSAAGQEVTAFCRADSRLDHRLRKTDTPSIRLTRYYRYMPLSAAWRLAREVRKRNIQIVHVHHSWDLLLCVLAKRFSGGSFNLVYTRQMEFPFPKHDPYHRWIYSNVDLLLCITEKLKNDAGKYIPIPSERIKRLYYGIPPADLSERDCQSLADWEQAFKVAVFSRIQSTKGQHTVLEAAGLLKKQGLPVHYFFYGDVMESADMERLRAITRKHGLEDNVHFMGFADRPREVMGCFDLVIQPSERETFGLVLIEAMREGVAVIGTRAGGIPEIIDHEQTGLLYTYNDHQTLSLQIKMLYQDSDKRKMLAMNGKQKADREFDEMQHFDRLQEVFEKRIQA